MLAPDVRIKRVSVKTASAIRRRSGGGWGNSLGLSIVTVILALLILSLFGAVAVSIISTSASVSLQEEQGLQAFFIAEGGLEYAFKNGTYCNYNGISGALGEGDFHTSSVFANAVVSGAVSNTASTVYLTSVPQIGFTNSGFSFPGMVGIDSEYLFCTGNISNSLTGCSRGFAGSVAAPHSSGADVEQCAVRSTGTVSKGLSFGSVRRVTQVNIVEVDE